MKRFLFALFPLLLASCASQSPAPVVDRTTSVAPRASEAAATGAIYIVKRGETLYRIALERGISYRDLAAWNNITDPASLSEGQVLRLTPPGASDSAVAVTQPIQSAGAVETRPLESSSAGTTANVKRDPKVAKEAYSDGAWESLQKPAGATSASGVAQARPAGATDAGSAIGWGWPSADKMISNFGDNHNKGIDFSGKEGDPIMAAAEGKVFFVGRQKGYGNLLIIGHANGFISVYAHNRRVLVTEKQMVTKGQKVAEMGKTDSESGVKLHFEIRQAGKPIDPSIYLPPR